jgi:hypothetical protein
LSKSAKIAKIINNSTTQTKLKFLQTPYLLTMTKKKASRTQKSTLDTIPITPRRLGGRTGPRGFIPYDGTKEEEIKALKLVFRLDRSNPYKDDTYNIRRVPANCDFYMEINNWDGQTHCPRTDCIALKHPFNTSYAVKCYVFAPVLTVCRARAITNPIRQ